MGEPWVERDRGTSRSKTSSRTTRVVDGRHRSRRKIEKIQIVEPCDERGSEERGESFETWAEQCQADGANGVGSRSHESTYQEMLRYCVS